MAKKSQNDKKANDYISAGGQLEGNPDDENVKKELQKYQLIIDDLQSEVKTLVSHNKRIEGALDFSLQANKCLQQDIKKEMPPDSRRTSTKSQVPRGTPRQSFKGYQDPTNQQEQQNNEAMQKLMQEYKAKVESLEQNLTKVTEERDASQKELKGLKNPEDQGTSLE